MLNSSNFQSILAEARKAFGPARDAWLDDSAEGTGIGQEKKETDAKQRLARIQGTETGQNNAKGRKSFEDIDFQDVHAQLSEKNAIIRKYEAQSKKFVEEITELQTQNDNHKKTI